MMKILHITEDHSVHNAGVTSAVDNLVRLVARDLPQGIFCTGSSPIPVIGGVEVAHAPSRGMGKPWHRAPGGGEILGRRLESSVLAHAHGIWNWPQWAGARRARRLGIPMVLSVHGMLQPYQWARSTPMNRLKKSLYWKLLAAPAFKSVAVIHAITHGEEIAVRGYFPGRRVVVIPNAIDLGSVDRSLAALPEATKAQDPYVLFVGRLCANKGVHLLLRAFAPLAGKGFRLKIVGPTSDRDFNYVKRLHQLALTLGIADRVDFTGPVYGDAKWELYRAAWVFCLPSLSEVIGFVNLEAAACGTPVIATREAGLLDGWAGNGGLLIHPTVEGCRDALAAALAWTPEDRERRGRDLRAFVRAEYSTDAVRPRWLELYRGLLQGRGPH